MFIIYSIWFQHILVDSILENTRIEAREYLDWCFFKRIKAQYGILILIDLILIRMIGTFSAILHIIPICQTITTLHQMQCTLKIRKFWIHIHIDIDMDMDMDM